MNSSLGIYLYEITKINKITDHNIDSILKVWESSIRATHNFLNEGDIKTIIPQVREGLVLVDNLVCVRNNMNDLIAFMGVQDKKIEMLFVDADYIGKGIGKKFMDYAVKEFCVKYVDVNEQNYDGVNFYKHMGFEVFSRSEYDDYGNSFPILHMKLMNLK